MEKNNLKNIFKSKKFIIAISFVGLFLVSVGISLIVFYFISPKGTSNLLSGISKKTKINIDLPKTEECPINGAKYTKAESEIWGTRRPIAAMIENHLDARPESGLSRADVVYEAVAEGGITRFVGVFYCGASAEDVQAAPIRSARVYFMNMAAGYGTNPIFLHQGGANNICSTCPGGVKPSSQINSQVNTLTLFDKLGWSGGSLGNNFDSGYNIGYPIVVRDQYRLDSNTPAAWEHSVVADLILVWQEATKRGFGYKEEDGVAWTKGFRKWIFQDGKANTTPVASDIKFDFWESMPGYNVEWKYDTTSNSYARFNGDKAHVDWEFEKSQLSAKNVVIMFVKETGPLDSEHHMLYQVIGTGKSLVFQNGEVIQGTWKKATALDREVFYDTNGKEIQMVRGATWVELLPALNEVTY
jgi:hypothetical protein